MMPFGPPSPLTQLVPSPSPGARIDAASLQTILVDALDTAYSRGRVIVSDRRDDSATTGPAAPYRIVANTVPRGMALLWMLPYTVPTPLPGSANRTGGSTGGLATTRGALRLLVRGSDVRVRLAIYPLTLPHTVGTPTTGTVTLTTLAWGTTDVLFPVGVAPGDLCAIHLTASADAGDTGLVSAFSIIEPTQTDLTP